MQRTWFTWWSAAVAASPAWAGPADDDVTALIAAWRDGVVLAEGASDLPDGRRDDVTWVGIRLQEARRERTEAALAALRADLGAPRRPGRQTLDWLTHVERDVADGDLAALSDLLAALTADVAALPAGRLQDDATARIAAVRRRADTAGQAFREEARSGVRAGWSAYVEGLDADVDAVLAAWSTELSRNTTATRGWADNPLEVFGTTLPDRTFVLTFDDGPHATHTPEILRILREHGVHAVFFQVGRNVGRVGEDGDVALTEGGHYARQIVAEGHLLGSHTWSHKNLPTQDDATLATQLDLADTVLDAVSGEDVRLIRPPYGGRDERVLAALQERGARAYLWNVDSRDWADPVPESVAATVLDQVRARGHGVLLFHDVHPQTVAALPLVLSAMQSEGYRFVLWDGEHIVGERGAGAPAAPPPPREDLYADSWAVVVGVDDYAAWPRLSHAVADAEAVADALVDRFGFPEDHVVRLYDADATRADVLRVLGDELPGRVGPDDRVFVYFAGHGATRDLPGGGQRGYLVPVDGDAQNLQSTAISLSDLDDVQALLPAKHVLLVTDACYSGVALTRAGGWAGDPRRFLREVTSRRARQILTAGGADEPVSDQGPDGHSIFAWTLLQALDGAGDLNGDGFLTASELSAFVAPRVSALSAQTPAFGSLAGSAGGDFVFTLDASQALLSDLSSARVDDAELARAKAMLAAKEEETRALQAELSRLAALAATRGADPTRRAAELHAYGLAQYREGRVTEAYEALSEAVRLAPDDVELVNNVGYVLQQLGEHDQARGWFDHAIALDANRAVAWLNRADSLAALGQRDAAAADYRRYLEMVPDSPARRRIQEFLVGG
jgi:peptidoglycan/xylan/chitin deacetylase (PgdA/CDA1 family)/uncharacterized caspase-like protein